MDLRPIVRPLLAAATGLLLLAGCGGADSDGGADGVAIEDVTEKPGLDYGPLGEVVADGDRFLGQTVTVSGEVTAQVDDRVFHIAGESGADGLLVISEQPVVEDLDSDDVVEVVGTVRERASSTFETEFGIPYDDDYDSFGGRHAVLATSVEVIGQAEDEVDAPQVDEQGEDIAED